MDWPALRKLYSGIIGNTVFVLSLISIVATVPFGKQIITSTPTSIAILGALMLCVAYGVCKICTPPVIATFRDKAAYYEHVCGLEARTALITVDEFSRLDNFKLIASLGIPLPQLVETHKPATSEDYIRFLGRQNALLVMSELNYALIGRESRGIRYALSIALCVGAPMLFCPAIIRITNVFLGGIQ